MKKKTKTLIWSIATAIWASQTFKKYSFAFFQKIFWRLILKQPKYNHRIDFPSDCGVLGEKFKKIHQKFGSLVNTDSIIIFSGPFKSHLNTYWIIDKNMERRKSVQRMAASRNIWRILYKKWVRIRGTIVLCMCFDFVRFILSLLSQIFAIQW